MNNASESRKGIIMRNPWFVRACWTRNVMAAVVVWAGLEAEGLRAEEKGVGKAATSETTGWRGDWTGRYPDAKPVTEWGYWPRSPNWGLRYQLKKPAKDDLGKSAAEVKSRQLLEWLVLGPFEPKDAATAMDEEFLPKEGELAPDVGETTENLVWTNLVSVNKSPGMLVDTIQLNAIAKGKPNGVVYAHLYLFSQSKGKIVFYLDQGKGAKLWVNGRVIHNNPKAKSISPALNYVCWAAGAQWFGELLMLGNNAEAQKIPVELEKGWNRVLFKANDWLNLRLVEMPDVQYEKKNVVWATKLPNWSNGMPIIVGDRIFLMAEPDELICVNKADGKILWKRRTTLVDATPGEDKKRFPQFTELDKLNAELKAQEDPNLRIPIRKKIVDLLKQVDDEEKRSSPEYQEIYGLQAKLKDAAASEADKAQVVQEIKKKLAQLKCAREVNPLYQLIEPIEKQLTRTDEAHRAGLERKLQEDLLTLGPKPRYTFGPGAHIGGTGWTCGTPVSDGKNVYTLTGWGIAACYDLDGNMKWAHLLTDLGGAHSYNIAMPLLSDDKVIVFRGSQLRALDKTTGKVLWTSVDLQSQVGVDIFHGFGTTPSYATSPCLAKIGDTPVVFFESSITRVSDGKVFAKIHLDFAGPRSTPSAFGDSVYVAAYNAVHRVSLPGELKEGMVLNERTVANSPIPGNDGGVWVYSSPLLHAGLFYVLHSDPTHNTLMAYDVDKMQEIYAHDLNMGHYGDYDHPGTVASLALGGNYIFAFDNQATGVVIAPGRTFKEVARNRLDYCVERIFNYSPTEMFTTAPVFEGERFYLRGEQNLYCIGEE